MFVCNYKTSLVQDKVPKLNHYIKVILSLIFSRCISCLKSFLLLHYVYLLQRCNSNTCLMKILLHLYDIQDPNLKFINFTHLQLGFTQLFALMADYR